MSIFVKKSSLCNPNFISQFFDLEKKHLFGEQPWGNFSGAFTTEVFWVPAA